MSDRTGTVVRRAQRATGSGTRCTPPRRDEGDLCRWVSRRGPPELDAHRDPITFDTYDERVARGLVAAHDAGDGLPGGLGIRLVEMSPGGLRAVIVVRPDLLTPFGNLHCGVLAARCDHVLGVVSYPVMPRGAWAATTEFKLNYLAPVTAGEFEATATIVALSKRTAVVRIDVANDGRAVCMAQGRVLVMPPKAGGA